ncbi:DOMON-like domain-containing protein [Sphingomonas sp. H39-1-10]|nr:DOMON-like domain-containing protein [Sphingomonas pollutisoli]MDF0489482.1 DOMON-like domain-containing protein [Sphingomonas pollutisoli]SDA29115.1 hypothetical protein SAMN03159340_02308 [Sphingomonas sp. NFR15]
MANTYALVAHPDFPNGPIDAITVTIERQANRLVVRFEVSGAIEDVLWPGDRIDCALDAKEADERRADELWRHSCFEAFVAPADAADYREFNLATSGKWAAYAFDTYRVGMRKAGDVRLIEAHWRFDSRRADIRIAIELPYAEPDWALAVTAIVEARDGAKSYWALAHAPGAPDFHNRDTFVVTLPA